MNPEHFTTAAIDYLQRTGAAPPAIQRRTPVTAAEPARRRMLQITGVGQFDKQALPRPGEAFRLISEDLLVGLYNYKIPVAFEIAADSAGRRIGIGTWLPDAAGSNDNTLEVNAEVLNAVLSGLYPAIDVQPHPPRSKRRLTHGGMVLGIPSAKQPESSDGTLPVDRLLRAMAGSEPWSVLVLGQALTESTTQTMRLQVLNEIRAVTGAAAGMGQRPTSQHYAELLTVALKNLTQGQGGGLWRTGVYLLGDDSSYYRLASAWRGIFSGAASIPEPVRVFDDPEVCDLAGAWALPDPGTASATPEPPGHVRHPFPHQTLLTSTQLSAYVHLPRLETRGFAVTLVPDFDVVPAPVAGERLMLGHVVEPHGPGVDELAVSRDGLTAHAFVTGVTGSGKTNTITHLLVQADHAEVPFLVIEPAKTEYRKLLDHSRIGSRLHVFTPGNETVAPLRFNPFEFPSGIPVGVHIDLLRSAFNASFGMWTPLPQVLEECIHEVYRDRGWNAITSTNNRLLPGERDRTMAFPVLGDLLIKIDEVASRLGYEERITSDIRAALRTRLGSLCSGGKGRLLNVQQSTPLTGLLDRPIVIELEGLGDDDDKAFVMGLLLVRLAEQRRLDGATAGLRHLLVIEEAHRLLSNPGGGKRDELQADPRSKAVETFTHLLAEVRVYGQGVIIVDQVPTKLAPDVIKNTSLKIAHRLVAGDDRAVLGAAMAMSERQQRALAVLDRGSAAIATEGQDCPLLVKIPVVEIAAATGGPDDERIKSSMAAARAGSESRIGCRARCGEDQAPCDAAASALEDHRVRRTFSRLVFSALFDPCALARCWPELVTSTEPARPPRIARDVYLRAVIAHGAHWLSERRGAQSGWLYSDTTPYGEALCSLMAAQAANGDTAAMWKRFVEIANRLELGPGQFPACQRIWNGSGPPSQVVVCRCRFHVSDVTGTGLFDAAWRAATEAGAAAGDGTRSWELVSEIAYQIVEFPKAKLTQDVRDAIGDRGLKVALCVAQQLMAREPTAHPRDQAEAIARLLRRAGP